MLKSPSIQYLTRKEINVEKWDNCIAHASNGLIYAYAYYLDAVCTNWDAIVVNDYESVMPLPWRIKYFIRYVYQPTFVQRLGIFGNSSSQQLTNIYKEGWRHFSFIHYNVSDNVALPKVKQLKKKNFIIDLGNTYEQIKLSYSKECLLNIKKAEARGCYFTNEVSEVELVDNYRTAYGSKNRNVKEKDYQQFFKLLQEAKQKNTVELLGVKNRDSNTIYTAAIFKDNKRLYYMLGAPTPEGRQKRATYFFIDNLIRLNAGSTLHFDFEGSDIPNVEAFYKKFGPDTEVYFEVKTLSALMKMMK